MLTVGRWCVSYAWGGSFACVGAYMCGHGVGVIMWQIVPGVRLCICGYGGLCGVLGVVLWRVGVMDLWGCLGEWGKVKVIYQLYLSCPQCNKQYWHGLIIYVSQFCNVRTTKYLSACFRFQSCNAQYVKSHFLSSHSHGRKFCLIWFMILCAGNILRGSDVIKYGARDFGI